jgi:Protein of unknown function (DUF2510)
MNSPAPGWHPDPTSRHQYRYWDGARWTDDVADGGVASTDTLHEASAGATDPNPTASDATQRVDPTRQYPVAGQQDPTSGPYYGDQYGTGQYGDQYGTGQYGDRYGTGQPPPTPARKRPPTALIAALAVLAVALVGGLVYFLVRDDDDGSSDNTATVSDEDTTTTEGESQDGGDSGNGGGETTLPDDIDSENVDELVDLMAEEMAESSNGALTREEATCISQGMLDELGLERLVDIGESGENPFTDPELTSRLFSIMEDCGVTLEDLAASPD